MRRMRDVRSSPGPYRARRSRSARALVLGAAILGVVSLAGCGQSDPFVGSWATAKDAPPVALISRAEAGDVYAVTLLRPPGSNVRLRLVRDGDRLSVTRPMHYPGPPGTVPRTFRFTRTGDGGLTYFEGEPGAVFAELQLVRVSESTVSASASATSRP